MKDRIQELVRRIKQLEEELVLEVQKKETEFFYEIQDRTVHFEADTRRKHEKIATTIRSYVFDAAFLNILTAPVVWSCLIPALLIDLFVSAYQIICFPVYGIPRVRRGDYIVLDRHYLGYLNAIEKLNCVYCGYFNGLGAYIQEVAARTEAYWCPIKHARRLKVKAQPIQGLL